MQIKFPKLFFILLPGILLLCCTHKTKIELPKIYITTEEVIPWEYYLSCELAYVTDLDSLNLTGKVKCRGGISSKYYKHSYSLKLSEPYALCDLPANKSWIFNASYIDKTFMRHKICYDLFRMMGDYNIAPECAYALLRENGKPQGLYIVMQRLNKHVLQLNTMDTNAVIFKEPKIFYSDSLYAFNQPNLINYHEQTYPDFDKGEDYSEIMDSFKLFLTNSSDEEFQTHIEEWMDLHNIIDWQLLLLFTNNSDGVLKNFYFYKQDTNTPFRVALWDCDHSFGRDGDNERNMLERPVNYKRNMLFNRLMEMPGYLNALSDRYKQLRDSQIFSLKNIERMVQENDAYVKSGLIENERLWPCNGEYYFDDNNYEQEKALLLEFVPLSLRQLDEYFGYR